MAPVSISSIIFAIISLLVIALGVLVVIRHYLPLRSTPGYLLVPVFLALALPCSIILLVPIDLASAEADDFERLHAVWLPEEVVLVTWRITYWLTFVLTWFVLPFLGEYCDSGYRDARDRTIHSLRTNARYQLIVLATGIVGLVYFILENGFHIATIKGLIMALAYAWGLILAVGLMGHGLVALPRRLFQNAHVSARLRTLQTQAPKIKDLLDDATEKLAIVEQTVIQLSKHKGGASREQQEWIDELADLSASPDLRPGASAMPHVSTPAIPGVVTDRYLADLARKLKRARHHRARFVNEWSILCQQARDAQTILDASSTRQLDFGRESTGSWSVLSKIKLMTPGMRFHLHMNIIPWLRILLSVLLGAASSMVIWSEVIKPFFPALSVIGLSIIQHPYSEDGGKINFFGQLIAAAWLLYMDASALYAISDVKVWGNRALVKRQTYAESACWYSLQVAKLTVPLSFNFVTIMPKEAYQDTSFYKFLGQLIDLTPLGKGFSAFFPCVLLLPVLATSFNLYGKAKGILGFGVLEDDSEENPSGFGTGGWREGKTLIERELQNESSGGTTLNLSDRGPSLDLEHGRGSSDDRTPARSWQQPSDANAPRAPAAPEPDIRAANRQFRAITGNEEAEEDDSPRHFYQDFAERVRNTLDTAERPAWVKNIGIAFKTPRWAQGDQRDSNGGSSLSRWFGGRPEDGRVRI